MRHGGTPRESHDWAATGSFGWPPPSQVRVLGHEVDILCPNPLRRLLQRRTHTDSDGTH